MRCVVDLVGIIVAVMEAFQHLNRSTVFRSQSRRSDNTFLSEVAESGYSRATFTCNIAVTSLESAKHL